MAKYVTKTFMFEGRRIYVRGKDEVDAEVKRKLKMKELEEGKRELTKNTITSKWCYEWLDTYKKPAVNARHYKDIRNCINNFIIPEIGSMKLRSVRPVHLQKILNGLTNYSDSYIDKIYDVIRQIFLEAYHNGLVVYNPAESLKKPAGKGKTKRRAITAREKELTLKVCEYHRGGLFILIMLYCGLRPGEVAALRWKDVDLRNNIITVHQALKSDNTIGKPKTESGSRAVPIPTVLAERLFIEKDNPFDLVCKNTQGNQYTESSIQAMWENFRRCLNIEAGCKVFRNKLTPPYPIAPDLTLYCYRHTYCTNLQAAGVPINVAKELMGHSSIQVTAQIYTHKSDVAFNNAALLINYLENNGVALGVAQEAESLENTGNNA